MLRIRTALALLLLLPAAASAQELDTAVSAVVRISGTRGGTPVRGSGFVVGLDRDKATIVTASHVIEGVQQLEVAFAVEPTESLPAGVVLGMESGNPRGLAVFQVRGALPAGVAPLIFETESQLQRGEDVFLLGFPEMATVPLTLGMSFAGPDGNFLRLDRPAGEGLSGAPVLRKGKVVGVVTAEDLRLTYAVKAMVARDAVIGWGGKVVEKCMPREESTENGLVFVRVCPGTFIMGSVENGSPADSNEKPAHQVTLSEFWIGKTEITNKQYRSFRPNHQGEDELPATGVRWDDAEAACEHFGGRLPTEAQWEYAARAGSQAAWSFGSNEKLLADHAWYDENAGNKPHHVAMRKPNAWELYDMHGNLWEWVADWYATYPVAAQSDPTGPANGAYRVIRGGAFFGSPGDLRSASRGLAPALVRFRFIGFRCVRSPRPLP